MSSRLTARDRLSRLREVVPWVVQQPDGANLDELAERFDYPREQLIDDLTEILFFVGAWPYTPDTLIEVEIADDRVYLHNTAWFSQPLRLSAEESVRLMTAGRSALSAGDLSEDDGDAPHSALMRALTKLGTALGSAGGSVVDVRLGHDPGDARGVLRSAVQQRRTVQFTYHSFGRDQVRERTVEPLDVFSDQGNWYVSAFCRDANNLRTFRLDRIGAITVTDERFEREATEDHRAYEPGPDDPTVTLRLSPEARWVAGYYPCEVVGQSDDHLDIRLTVGAQPWLDRLLLRLGSSAEVLHIGEPLSLSSSRVTAQAILRRYRGDASRTP